MLTFDGRSTRAPDRWRVEQVAQRLGHASVRTTLDWYTHPFEGHDDELLADLAGLIREASAPTVPPRGTDVLELGGREAR